MVGCIVGWIDGKLLDGFIDALDGWMGRWIYACMHAYVGGGARSGLTRLL